MRTASLTLGAVLLAIRSVDAAEPAPPLNEYRIDRADEQKRVGRASRPTSAAAPDTITEGGRATLLTPSRELALTVGVFGADACVDVWISGDGGRSWHWTGQRPDSMGVLRHSVEADGVYQFYVVATNAAGSSANDPSIGAAPHATIEVDATMPTFQLLSASWPAAGDPLTIRAVLIDEHALPELRIFFREAPGGAWRDGGAARLSRGALEWRPRTTITSDRIDLRAVAADRAGNCVFGELAGIAVPAAPPPAHAVRPQVAPDAIALAAHDARTARASADDDFAAEKQPPATSVSEVAGRQKALASQFAQQGRFDLALARLDDALAAQPNDAELLTAAGDACLELGKLDAAETRFAAALRADPSSLHGRRGAARLAAARGRHDDARRQLLRLIELAPQDAAAWLGLGDAEFQLGRADAASQGWRQAMALTSDETLREQARRRMKQFIER